MQTDAPAALRINAVFATTSTRLKSRSRLRPRGPRSAGPGLRGADGRVAYTGNLTYSKGALGSQLFTFSALLDCSNSPAVAHMRGRGRRGSSQRAAAASARHTVHYQTGTAPAASRGISSPTYGVRPCALAASALPNRRTLPTSPVRLSASNNHKSASGGAKSRRARRALARSLRHRMVAVGRGMGQRKRVPSAVGEKEMTAEHKGRAHSLQSRTWQRAARGVSGAPAGATAVPAYRVFSMRLVAVVEDLDAEGGRQISHLQRAYEKSGGQLGSQCKKATPLHRNMRAPWID